MSDVAEARSLGELLKALGNSIAHPQKQPRTPSATRKDTGKQSTTKEASPTPTPSVAPPSQPKVRAATAAPAAKGGKRDVPYGIPVPGKQGLVTSPFAPDEGYVDVRGFPTGAEVKDPYTGKIFRTP